MPSVRWIAALLALAFVAAACGSAIVPNATLTQQQLALKALADHQRVWTSKGIDDYRITIERQCFCPGGQLVFTVVDGVVTGVVNDQGQVLRPTDVPDQPKTVPELFALVAGLPAESAVNVSYNEDFGFPSLISVDPIPNAIDDEYTIVVHDFSPAS